MENDLQASAVLLFAAVSLPLRATFRVVPRRVRTSPKSLGGER
jgi:hypothetical protein